MFTELHSQQIEKMANTKSTGTRMRVIHRYLGFFLAGIMAVYAISGIVLIFRDTAFLKQTKHEQKNVAPNLSAADLGKQIKMRNLEFTKTVADTFFFKNGTYAPATGFVKYSTTQLPFFVNKLTQLHKASTKQPLFFLNIFFGISLLFFVLSSFWMFRPKSSIMKKGLYFTAAGIVLTVLLLYMG